MQILKLNLSKCRQNFSTQFPKYLLEKPFNDPPSTFRYQDLQIERNPFPSPPVSLRKDVVFGTVTTDHMLTIQFSQNNQNNKPIWGKPRIHKFEDLSVHPFSSGLNYAVQTYEGMKAYKDTNGKIRLFRPQLNMNRFRNSCMRVSLPDFDGEELLKCIEELIRIDNQFIPSEPGFSLYVRPFAYATNVNLGVRAPDLSVINCVLSPVGPYYSSGFKPVGLYLEDQLTRCGPGGPGAFKLGSNYGPTIAIQKMAKEKGYNQILWTNKGIIGEVGTSNIFFIIESDSGHLEVITPEPNDVVLHGVTRDSVINILKSWRIKVTQRQITVDEILDKINKRKVKEVFAAGTAVVLGSVDKIFYKNQEYKIPIVDELGAGKFSYDIYQELIDIQYGRKEHEWSHVIN